MARRERGIGERKEKGGETKVFIEKTELGTYTHVEGLPTTRPDSQCSPHLGAELCDRVSITLADIPCGLAPHKTARALPSSHRREVIPEIPQGFFEAPTCLNQAVYPWIVEYLSQPKQPTVVPIAYLQIEPVAQPQPSQSHVSKQNKSRLVARVRPLETLKIKLSVEDMHRPGIPLRAISLKCKIVFPKPDFVPCRKATRPVVYTGKTSVWLKLVLNELMEFLQGCPVGDTSAACENVQPCVIQYVLFPPHTKCVVRERGMEVLTNLSLGCLLQDLYVLLKLGTSATDNDPEKITTELLELVKRHLFLSTETRKRHQKSSPYQVTGITRSNYYVLSDMNGKPVGKLIITQVKPYHEPWLNVVDNRHQLSNMSVTMANTSDDDGTDDVEADGESEEELEIITECWIEPLYGHVVESPPERQYMENLEYHQIADLARITLGTPPPLSPGSMPTSCPDLGHGRIDPVRPEARTADEIILSPPLEDITAPLDLCGRHMLQAGVEPVDKAMAWCTELSDFDKGVIVGCHLGELSSRVIAWKVNRPKSTVAFILRNWKVNGQCANAARSGRPPILTDRNHRTLKLEVYIIPVRWTCMGVASTGEWLLPECIVPTRKFGGGGVMCGACFTAFDVGLLGFVCGSMNTETYCNILDNEMLPTVWRFTNRLCYFQDDNFRCHVSRATMQWYADNTVRRLDWRAQSHDVNPIEHLWDKLDRRVRAPQAWPKSIAELIGWLQEEWR
ncbi:hypothetical protein PR048_013831 [Dryococelus australis]|uniref:Uncharacterized protein n=1 Tax=Dryococelus australis TaxID=614101 RepID=A0ABQ9HTB2_9NEOP|nr:hypothetical protein PR048_013831 [Dryococelus australis]